MKNLNKFDYYMFTFLSYFSFFAFIVCVILGIWIWQYRGELWVSALFFIWTNHAMENGIEKYKKNELQKRRKTS